MKLAESQRALELAYRFLSRRERTVEELRQHLLAREVDEAAARQVIEDLVEQGSLDDARFARLFVQDKRALEQWGIERIRRGLLARGVERALIDDVLTAAASTAEGDTELDRAVGLLQQRIPWPPQGRRERERALGLLLRKGYAPELALDALRAYARNDKAA